jgi:hypothetical protein
MGYYPNSRGSCPQNSHYQSKTKVIEIGGWLDGNFDATNDPDGINSGQSAGTITIRIGSWVRQRMAHRFVEIPVSALRTSD